MALAVVAGLPLVSPGPASADHLPAVTHDEVAFRAAIGPHTFEDFETGFETGDVVTNQVPGVTFGTDPGHSQPYVFASSSLVLFGGIPDTTSSGERQVFIASFSPPVSAIGFDLTSQDPSSSPATVRYTFEGGSSSEISVENSGGSESLPTYVGYQAQGPLVTEVRVTSGIENASQGFEEIALDDISFAAASSSPLTLGASRIAYASNGDGDRDIWVTDESGAGATNLTAGHPGHDSDPHLSPDGSRIAFVSDRTSQPGAYAIWVMDVDGTDPVQVTDGVAFDADPVWSPDGSQIAFASNRAGRFDIYVVAARGGDATKVSGGTLGVGSLDGFPTWSPDGGTIAFRSDRGGDFDIWTTTSGPEGGFTEAQLTDDPGRDDVPSYSPDGSIAFVSDRGGEGDPDIWVMGPDGRDQRPLVEQPGEQAFPVWSPDGRRIAFDTFAGGAADSDLHVLDVATGTTGATTALVGGPGNQTTASWWSSLSLTASSASTLPGAATVDPHDIPPSAIPLASVADVAGTPLRSVDIASSPLRSVPLRSVPLRSVPLRSVPLRSVTLSQIPLRSVGATWEAVLAGTPLAGVPLQNVTLDQLLALDPAPAGLASITLSDVDLASTPLRSVSMVSLAMGATPLRSVPVPGASSDPFTNWCTVLASLGYTCAALGLTEDSPILALDLAGVPLRSVPLRSVPLRSVPLRSVDVESLPLRSVPLRSVRLSEIELGGLALTAIDDAAKPALFTCSTGCAEATLGDAATNGRLTPAATLGMLFDAVDTGAFPEEWDLLDLLQGLVDVDDYPWETLPVEEIGIHDHAPDGAPVLRYDASFAVTGVGAPVGGSATVTLPPGFRYVRGSSTDGEVALPDPVVAGTSLTWTFPSLAAGATQTFSFDVRPGLSLRASAPSTLQVDVGTTTSSALGRAPVTVVEDHESMSTGAAGANDVPAGAVGITANTLVLSHIARSGDVDYFELPAPPKGTRLQVRLGIQGDTDLDVALLDSTASAPLRSVPLRSVPLRSVPIPDHGLTADAGDVHLSAETLDDIPGTDLASTPLRSVSQNRSSADELIDTTSNVEPAEVGSYLIQVSGFNGASSDQPYVLFVKQYAPPPPPACAGARTFPYAGEGSAGAAPPTLTGVETLILTSQERLGDTYGSAAAATVMTKLGELAGAAGVGGVVYPIEADPAAAGALAAWDADPCSPEKANDAFTAVSGIVDDVRAASPGLENVVLVGGDDIVPMARLADHTQLSNESDYTAEALTDDGSGNPIAAALATENILSDDPYGDLDPIRWLDHFLYVPELAVGRLVETPADIVAQVDQYVASRGVLDPTTALTAGYDFLTDGADAVDTALAARIPDGARSKLVNETWSSADLEQALYGAGAVPDIASLNAHYDHNRSLPALGNSTADESDLFTVANVRARPQALLKRILFTMGCHAGLAVPDAYHAPGSASADDWSETYLGADQRAAVYFANTGFGYGDTAAIALSERLMALFAERLDGSMTVGQAAVYAKQAYFGSLGAYGPYDEKALQEATFYGLPMYRIGTSTTTPPAPPTVTPEVSGSTGTVDVLLDVAASDFDPVPSPGGGAWFELGGGSLTVDGQPRTPTLGEAQVTQYRPIVPRTSSVVTSADPGLVAKGFLVSDLASTDRGTVPAVARPVVDLTTNEPPPPAGDVAFPTSFSNISTYAGPNGPEQRLVLLPGQVFRDASWSGSGAVQRLFTRVGGEITYGSAEGDQASPFLTDVVATIAGGTMRITLRATDTSGIAKVVVLVHDESGAWRPVELGLTSDGGYAGQLDVTGTRVEYFAQALDSAGNVGISTNKGRYYEGVPALDLGEEAPAPASLAPSATTTTAGGNGWYVGPVTVDVTGTGGIDYLVRVDGVEAATVRGSGTVSVAGDGAHLVEALGSDGTTASLVVSIDGMRPSVAVTGVVDGGQYPRSMIPGCTGSDATSGLASCTVTVTGGDATSQLGRLTATATAVDRAGNVATTSVTYDVGPVFSGFLQPINDTGHTLTASTSIFKAGSTVPVRLQLLDVDGQPVELDAAPLWLDPVKAGSVTAGPNESTTSAPATSGTSFVYDPDTGTYGYGWRTTKSMAGSYWRIGVQLEHGRTYWTYVGLK